MSENNQIPIIIDINSTNNYVLNFSSIIDKPIWNITLYYTYDGIYQSDFIDSSCMEYKDNNSINLDVFNKLTTKLDQDSLCTYHIFSNDTNITVNINIVQENK